MRKKIDYRTISAGELSERERMLVQRRRDAADAARQRRDEAVRWARKDRPGYDRLARWVVATCRVGTENAVSDSLAEAGIECWCPRERLLARPRRGLQAVDIFRPIFRGYLFVRVVPDRYAYAGLLVAAKLRGLMCQDGVPYLMPDTLMDLLQLAALETQRKQADKEDLPPLPDLTGKRGIVRSGPFADFTVTVRRLLSKKRKAVVEVPMFGVMKEVSLDVDSIEF